MKHIFFLMLTFVALSTSAQRLKREHKIIDSLNQVYKIYENKIIGYSRTVYANRETFLLFYIDNKGETKEMVAWSRIIKD